MEDLDKYMKTMTRSKHGKVDQKVCQPKSKFQYMVVFQHKHKKVDSKLVKSFLMGTSMLPLNFDELNTKFEKN